MGNEMNPIFLPTPPHPPPLNPARKPIKSLKAPSELTFQIQRMISPQLDIIILVRDRPVDL